MIKVTLGCLIHKRFSPEGPNGTLKDPAKVVCDQCRALLDLIETVRLYERKQKDKSF